MEIACSYCGRFFNNAMQICPGCGATNAGVVRKSGKQPKSIDALRSW